MSRSPIGSFRALAAGATLAFAACGGPGPISPVPASPDSGSAEPSGPLLASPSPTSRPSPSPSSPPAFDPSAVAIALRPVAAGFDNPLAVVAAGAGSGRLYVAEQGGRIRLLAPGADGPAAEPVLDIAGRISAGGERGLLGLAFHPDFPADPRFFVNYTDRRGDTVVASFRLPDPGSGRADPDSETVLLRVDQPFPNHNGGALAFGPDGMLFVATGDGGSGGDPHGNGQRLDTHLGKILRIDVDARDAERPYGTPADNPFVGRAGAKPEIWAYGLRNPWRMAFDRATGDLWIGDVGQGDWEEIDRIPAGKGGLNFGWNLMEGAHCFPSGDGCARPELTLPVTEYGHDRGCTVIGGAVYRGAAQPALAGGYVFADFCSGLVFVADPSGPAGQAPVVAAETGQTISSFGEDEAGELYATDLVSGELLLVTASPR